MVCVFSHGLALLLPLHRHLLPCPIHPSLFSPAGGHGKTCRGVAPSLQPGPTALSAIGPLLLLGWTSFGFDLIIRAARSLYGSVFTISTSCLPRSSLLPIDKWRTASWCSAARRSLAGCRPTSPPEFFLATCARSRPPLTARSGKCSAATSPSKSSGRHASAGALRLADVPFHVVVEVLLHRGMFCVLVSVCFGDGLDDGVVASVTALQRELLTSVVGFQALGSCPAVTKLLFRRRYKRMLSIRRRQEELFLPLIRARWSRRDDAAAAICSGFVAEECYADSLLGLRIPEEDGSSRNLTESEMVCLCSELLTSGTDSTVAVMQWTTWRTSWHSQRSKRSSGPT